MISTKTAIIQLIPKLNVKIINIMKLTIAFLMFACLQVHAKGWSQDKISLKMSAVEVKKVLFAIEKKSDYRFLFNEDALQGKPLVNVDVVDATITEVLDKVLANTGVSYKLMSTNLIVLKEGVSPDQMILKDVTVTGRVNSSSGEALPGVSILIKGSKVGTSTDVSGNFSITAPDDAVLIFSAVGYETQEVSIAGKTTLNVVLQQSAKKIDEVVVIGYGTASRRDLTGSIVKVQGKDVADKPNVNPIASLQSRVAGLSVVNAGSPGQEPDIRIRGTISIGSVKPLYVVDGVFNDNIDYVNPNDIESIEVLKDASSLAIFGVRGAPGVIVITTKRAKMGQVDVNFNTTWGFKQLTNKIKLADAALFKELFQEEEENLGITGSDKFNFDNWTGNTDWIDAITQTGMYSANNLSLSSSTEKNRFYMSVGYMVDQGIIKYEELKRFTLTINDEVRISKALKLGFNVSAIRNDNPFNGQGYLFDGRRVLPIADPVDPTTGYHNYLPELQRAQIANPLMMMDNKYDKSINTNDRIVGSVFAEINFLQNFSWKSTFYGDMAFGNYQQYNPMIYGYDVLSNNVYLDPNNRTTSVNQSKWDMKKFQQDHILTYKKSFGEHGLTAIGGVTTYYQKYSGLNGSVRQRLTGDSIPDDKRFWYVDNGFGDPATKRSSSDQWDRATASFLFRALYNYKGKYYLNASFRRDGSSIISPENRWQNFWAVGAAWEMTRENFMANQTFFDFLKLKASWGVLGNQNTYDYNYPYYPALTQGNTAVFGSDIYVAYSQAYLPNPNLKWETVDSKEIGFEFNALRNRLHVEGAYYSKTTDGVLTIVPGLNGAIPGLDNIGNIENSGFELAASWNQSLGKDWSLTLSANFTTYNNKVIELSTEGYEITGGEERPNRTTAGYPIGYFYGYVVEGLYQSYAEKLGSPTVIGYEYGPGDLKYKDVNGDGQIDAKDRTMIGNPTPDFAYGGTIDLKYKGFNFTVDVGGVYGNEIYRYWGSSELPFARFNYPEFKKNRWTGEGTSNWDPALGSNRVINRLPSTYGIEDGSYFRIRNLQLGYNFSRELASKIKAKNLRVFLNAQNLVTFKSNEGYTPEYGGSAISFGIDNGNGAIPAVYTAGLNVTF
jgi:TonB-linked SusC/RagA family outer membrane protein